MKIYILFIIGLLLAGVASAQTVTYDPAEFTAEDQVTMTVDFTGTDLEASKYTGNIYIWMFVDGCCDAPTNVNPAGPDQEAARLLPTATENVFTFTFVPTAFFNKTPGELLTLGFLFKGRDWSDGQTSDMSVDVVALEFVPVPLRAFPDKFEQSDVVTFYFDQNHKDVNSTLAALTEVYMYTDIKLTDGTEIQLVPWDEVGNTPEQMFTNEGDGIFTLTMVPFDFYELDEGQEIESIKIHVRSGPNPDFGGPEPPASLGDKLFSPIKADAVTGDF
ncbi:hypothetical protein R9C00_24515 [Flammeovirgaceae bacterium SG7u.111]|nr:hypothetical protein [Flammeovirgaceae bacterium SG7u.132]WPO34862.1 hypothetical protein R9C00_24515 [Flammeovirgaceae bacterium SG7u.111]